MIGSILELVLQSILVKVTYPSLPPSLPPSLSLPNGVFSLKDPYSMWRYSHIASSLRVLRLVQISRNTRLIVWTVLRSLEVRNNE